MKYYPQLTKRQAVSALEEFLAERAPALERFRQALRADGRDPDTLLDGTTQGLVPLWGWVLSGLTGPDAPACTDPATVPHEDWPSWERFTAETEAILSYESVQLLDGFISYLVRVVEDRTPTAQWQIGQHPNKRYQFRNHPVLAGADRQIFFPGPVASSAREVVRGRRAPANDEMAGYAQAVIEALSAEETRHEPPEPLVEVEDLGDHPIRGREIEVSLREDIAHEYSRQVDHMVKTLAMEDGITRVIREDREVLLVATPSWNTTQLQEWVTQALRDAGNDHS
ncbi:hypothetical protein IWX65_000700 [Arthrobacter sp. CAN_A214]|uniref:hypothetical protein n=1 Tax=Arthrobacter sp. CAN_A214 TaxID=2787720 RepID=UPI0018C8FE16